MTRMMVGLLKTVIVVLFTGVLIEQVLIPFMAREVVADLPEAGPLLVPYSAAAIGALAAVEVTLVAVWRLASMVRRGQIFTSRAFRWVDVIIGCAGVVAILALAVTVTMLATNMGNLVALLAVAGAAALGVGLGLLMLVMRGLLASAIADHDELAEVI